MINVILLGLVSFFVDVSTEMIYPLIPLFLTGTLGAKPAVVGLIEGIAESLASLLKVYSGYHSDKYQNKKQLAFFGYSTALIYKVALIFSGSWLGILGARIIDRFGKGIRTAPRDSLVADSTPPEKLGYAYGIHKALDMAGSALGILIAYFLLRQVMTLGDYRRVFLYSVIPAILGILILSFVKQPSTQTKKETPKFWSGFRSLDSRLKIFLLAAFLFNLGNSSNVFLLLKANATGADPKTVILLYFVYNLISSLLAIPGGKLSDKIGRKKLLISGYLVFASVYFGFIFINDFYGILLLFALYGVFIGLTAGVERAFIAENAPENLKGSILGLHSTIVGVALLPASIIAGLLWDYVGSYAPFALGCLLALISCLVLGLNRSFANEV